MKTIWLSLVLLVAKAAFAEDVKVELKGGGLDGSFVVTTNVTSCGRLNWDGVPDKSGAMSGGQYEITVQMVDGAVVLSERTRATDKGIGTDVTAKTTVPMARLPWRGKLSQTTAIVFRAEQRETRNPNEASQAIGAGAPQPER